MKENQDFFSNKPKKSENNNNKWNKYVEEIRDKVLAETGEDYVLNVVCFSVSPNIPKYNSSLDFFVSPVDSDKIVDKYKHLVGSLSLPETKDISLVEKTRLVYLSDDLKKSTGIQGTYYQPQNVLRLGKHSDGDNQAKSVVEANEMMHVYVANRYPDLKPGDSISKYKQKFGSINEYLSDLSSIAIVPNQTMIWYKMRSSVVKTVVVVGKASSDHENYIYSHNKMHEFLKTQEINEGLIERMESKIDTMKDDLDKLMVADKGKPYYEQAEKNYITQKNILDKLKKNINPKMTVLDYLQLMIEIEKVVSPIVGVMRKEFFEEVRGGISQEMKSFGVNASQRAKKEIHSILPVLDTYKK